MKNKQYVAGYDLEELFKMAEEIEKQEQEKRDNAKAEAEADYHERTVFTADIQGAKFKGTKSDFDTFISGMIRMVRATQ